MLGTFLQAFAAGLADAVAHFAGGPLGERDGHELAQPRRPLDGLPQLPSGSNSARNRSVSTNVLPQPAPADSATDTPRAVTARRCWSVRCRMPLVRQLNCRTNDQTDSLGRRRLACLLQGTHLIDSADGAEGAAAGAVVVGAADGKSPARESIDQPHDRVAQPGADVFPLSVQFDPAVDVVVHFQRLPGLEAAVAHVPVAGPPGKHVAVGKEQFHRGDGVERQLQRRARRDGLGREIGWFRPSCSRTC